MRFEGHTASGKEPRIGGVDDRVEFRLSGDVAAHTAEDDGFDPSFMRLLVCLSLDCLFAACPAVLGWNNLWGNRVERTFLR